MEKWANFSFNQLNVIKFIHCSKLMKCLEWRPFVTLLLEASFYLFKLYFDFYMWLEITCSLLFWTFSKWPLLRQIFRCCFELGMFTYVNDKLTICYYFLLLLKLYKLRVFIIFYLQPIQNQRFTLIGFKKYFNWTKCLHKYSGWHMYLLII